MGATHGLHHVNPQPCMGLKVLTVNKPIREVLQLLCSCFVFQIVALHFVQAYLSYIPSGFEIRCCS